VEQLSLPEGLARAAWLALGLVFQKPCLACGERVADPREAGFCPSCWEALERWPSPPVRPHLGEAPDFEALAAFAYEGWLRELVHAWKFDGRSALTLPLARRMARRLKAAGAAGYDAVVALPPSPASLRERGFDAGGDLAQAAARQLGLPVLRPLKQLRARRRQSGLKRRERLDNALGLYAVEGGALRGQRLLILDDLLSTGATAQAAAAALLDAGALEVGVGVLAHAVAA
jgi:predicted amidophosphoribosyltransferase